jgi:hypothetical protein
MYLMMATLIFSMQLRKALVKGRKKVRQAQQVRSTSTKEARKTNKILSTKEAYSRRDRTNMVLRSTQVLVVKETAMTSKTK